MIRQEDDFLMPGERLKSKNGYSVVIIEGLSPHGYRGVAHFRIGTDDYQEQKVIIGNNWKASYERIPSNKGTRAIPIESQIPYPPTSSSKKKDHWFRDVKQLIASGWSIRNACKECKVSPMTYRARLEQEQMENVEEEFNR